MLVIILFGGLTSIVFFVEWQLGANIDFGSGPAANAYSTINKELPSFFGGEFGIISTLNLHDTGRYWVQ